MPSTRDTEMSDSESDESGDDSGEEPILRGTVRFKAVARRGITNTIEFKKQHQTFYNNLKLSALVAFWITLFSLPSFSVRFNRWTFGDPICQDYDLRQTYVAHWKNKSANTARDDIVLNLMLTKNQHDVLNKVPNASELTSTNKTWCGILPKTYYSNWPNVIQMIVFTVYQNTGVTIQNSWQGIFGTFAAVFNHWMMCLIWPDGGNGFLIWLDILGFFFVVLLSGAAENTMKFSMNWHAWFMMKFVSSGPTKGKFPIYGVPHAAWDSFTTTCLLTSTTGALIAVVATLFPPPAITNYRNVSSNAELVASAMRRIWNESIEYFCGREPSAHKVVIAEAITNLNLVTGKALNDLSASWWEGFDLCGRGRKRQLYMAFDTTALKMDAVMVAVKDSIMKETFEGSHVIFCEGMRSSMESVKESAAHLFEKCEQCCQDGEITEEEVEELRQLIDEVKHSQASMLQSYRNLSHHEEMSGAKFVSEDLASENTFVFALSVWARKIQDFAENIIKISEGGDQSNSCAGTLREALRTGFKNTWARPNRDKFDFALRNWLVISSVFVIGYEFHCGKCVFTDRSANMAALLTLLINHYSGSAFLNNLKRLIGVIIGKVLPVLILSFLDPANNEGIFRYFDCSGPDGSFIMAFVIFGFAWFFNYMYYTQKDWGLIGCLAAAFGVSGLIPLCGSSGTGYTAKYKEIAQDVFAIFLGLLIDEVFDWIRGKAPRESAITNIKKIQDDFEEGFSAFFRSDLQKMEDSLAKAKDTITTAQLFAHEADPKMKMVPGWRTDFKVDLYKTGLQLFHLLHSDLAMLIFALKAYWVPDPPPKDGNDDAALQSADQDVPEISDDDFDPMHYMNNLSAVKERGGLQEQLMGSLEMVFTSLHKLLSHDAEGSQFQGQETTRELMVMSRGGGRFNKHADLYHEINSIGFKIGSTDEQITQDERVKVTVICRALENAKEHLNEIQALLSKYIQL